MVFVFSISKHVIVAIDFSKEVILLHYGYSQWEQHENM